MKKKRYILALDEGTTSARTLIYDVIKGETVAVKHRTFSQLFPVEGWVEHNAEEIWTAQYGSILDAISTIEDFTFEDVYGIGVTNQRETVVCWDKRTLTPIYNAIVWQCRRTKNICEELAPYKETIKLKTGLVLDAYFSATKIKWILDNVKGAKKLMYEGNLGVGTIDTFLIAKLTKGKDYVTDFSNASRTMLFNINTLQWDDELCKMFGIEKSCLPTVCNSSEIVGYANILENLVPIGGIAGDQQAALFGQACFDVGMAKNTYGTGCFILSNIGDKPIFSKNDMITTIAWGIDRKITYALEGSIFNAGSSIQWLRDELNLIENSAETEDYAKSVDDTKGVYMVPAFTGLGAPYWDMNARGVIVGLTRGTNKAHIIRATLESMAYSTRDIIREMELDLKYVIHKLKVDGGASNNNFLMQFQADILGIDLERPWSSDSTALGVVYLTGLSTGAFRNLEDIKAKAKIKCNFKPKMDKNIADEKYRGWKRAVERAKNWIE